MSESGLDRERYLLSDTESRRIFAERIVPTEFAGIAGVDRPVVHFFGGQPGAGKSVAQSAVTTAIIAADGIGAVASIIGDDFRPHHPAYNRLLAEDDEAARVLHRPRLRPLGRASHRLGDRAPAARHPRRHLPSTRGHHRERQELRGLGLRGTRACVGGHKFVSGTRIFGRYYDQLRANGKGRYTLPAAHDASYDSLPAAVGAILDSGVFLRATAYDARGHVIAESGGPSGSAISDAVRAAHGTLPTADEIGDLLGLLERFEDTFVSAGKAAVARDLQALRLEILDAIR